MPTSTASYRSCGRRWSPCSLPWPLHLLTDLSTTLILWLQVLAFVAAGHRLVASNAVRHADRARRAWRHARRRTAAEALFLAHGVHLTEARTGVLIYVALAERRVEIVADAGINAKVEQAVWDNLAQAVTDPAREGRLADGLVAAVAGVRGHLAQHFLPPALNRNELANQVVEI